LKIFNLLKMKKQLSSLNTSLISGAGTTGMMV
jgi:hypothetical protein